MFNLSQERELEISRKVITTKKHKEIQSKLTELYNYIEEQMKDNKELLEAFSKYEDMNCLLITLYEEIYYKEGFKDGVSLYKD
jgi:hypothetical protein